jgi:hypothetical protein
MAALAVCVLAAGCGTEHVATPQAAGNRAAAWAEASRLLTLAKLPPGAIRLANPPGSLTSPMMGRPDVASLVDRTVSWQVRLPFAATRAWLSAHPPNGLHQNGNGSSGDAGVTTMTGTSYRGPASPAWQSADLEFAIAPAGPDASTIRVDAVVVWLDPSPVPSGPGTHPVRVTTASGCPATDRGVTGVTNSGAALRNSLLPPGQPDAGLRCEYDGFNGHPWHLVTTTKLTADAAGQAAESIARLPLSHTDGGLMISCPMDDGSAAILVLAYPGHPDVDLWIKLNGCATVSNGYISTSIPRSAPEITRR